MNEPTQSAKPWAGRFNAPTDAFVEAFTASVDFDRRLYRYDIQGSIAHATMLARQGILTATERDAIVSGLEAVRARIDAGEFAWSIPLEDVHMNVESALTADIGEAGKKLHTGRSRNDQVATDVRLWLRDEIDAIRAAIVRLQQALLDLAEREADTILPGFTHLQVAQPITFGHHMLAWFEMLERDRERLADCRRRMNVMPLGAAALAGTTYPIDRHYTAELLGFDRPAENSLDAVSDRDFAIEFTADAAILMMHLSRFSEELILWSSAQFGFVELSDSFCTGSSIMPQKKNPDVPELVRGKSGRVFGHLMGLLTLMKGQPLAYNKDNQEDKEPLFDTVDNLKGSLKVYADMMGNLTCNRERMRAAAKQGFSTATDLADYLVRRGIPFRDAHEIVGKAVALGVREGRDLADLTLAELRQFSEAIGEEVFAVLTLEGSVAARDHLGGTAPAQVRAAIARGRERLNAAGQNLAENSNPHPTSLDQLNARLLQFARERDWEQFHSPKNLAMALAGEAGELLEHFQWLTEAQSAALEDGKKRQVSHELADILLYLIRLSERLGVDLIAAAEEKIAINEQRYPAEKVRGDARRAGEYPD